MGYGLGDDPETLLPDSKGWHCEHRADLQSRLRTSVRASATVVDVGYTLFSVDIVNQRF